MKLFLSALLLAALPVAFAQNQPNPSQLSIGVAGMEGPNGQQSQAFSIRYVCPLYVSAASVASPPGYLPVNQRTPEDGTLTLHFRNQSGKAIRSASITATVKVKTNIYALDAHAIALRLSFSVTDDLDRSLDQLTQIALPRHYYLFGLAQVSLDRVTFADGTKWTNPKQDTYCRTNGQGLVEAK